MKVKYFQEALYQVARLAQSQKLHDNPQVQLRLKALEQFQQLTDVHKLRVRDAAAVIGVPLSTLYDWRKRFQGGGLAGLAPRSRRPRRVRSRQRSPELRQRLIELRKEYPGWGKRKLTVLLKHEGYPVSESTVGRLLSDLIRRGRIEPSPRRSKRRRDSHPRPWARRDFGGLDCTLGEVIQIDMMTVKLYYGVTFKQFTAVDVASRYMVGGLYRQATAKNAAHFLEQVLERMPFPVRAIQVDGGSEFKADFEQACQARKLPLLVLPPCSPKMNTRVEYAHGTCRREFYECFRLSADLKVVRRQLAEWIDVYNRIRPHESLDMKTPLQYVEEHSLGEACSEMS